MWTFRAMDTEVTIAALGLGLDDEEAVVHAAAALFIDTERRFSRFLPDSELARLNRGAGAWPVSAELLELLAAAGRHVAATEGLFDPTIGAALVHAGYDRSFVPGALDRATRGAVPARARFGDLRIDAARRTVTRPAHVQLDFGGFLKGRTVDRAAALLPGAGVVDAGGDAVLKGAGPDGAGWRVDVEDPADAARVLVTLRITDRAVATSAPNRRRWRLGDDDAHHLIDPRTARPAVGELAQVTALAATAEEADVLAKVAFLRGADGAARLLARPGRGGVLVDERGQVRVVGDVALDRADAVDGVEAAHA